MGRLARHLLVLARANRLANHRLDAACASLSHDEWTAPRTGFFPSIAATLNHVLIVDWYYLDALEEGGLGVATYADPMPCDTVAALTDAQCEADRRLIAFCERMAERGERDETDAALALTVAFDRGPRGRLADRIDLTLGHLFLHQTHHRGQAHAMLSGTSVAPPQLDEFVMATDANARVDDVAAVGFTERHLVP